MAILAECPLCHKKQATKNKLCACGGDLEKAKRSKRVKYWINYRLPNGKQKRAFVGAFKDLNGYSIEDARKAESKRKVQKAENRLLDIKPATKMTFQELTDWYLGLKEIKVKASYEKIEVRLKRFNAVFGDIIVSKMEPTDLKGFQIELKEQGLSDSYIDNIKTQVVTALNTAIDNNKLDDSVLKPFNPKKVPQLLKKNANARDRILTREEFNSLLTEAPRHLLYALATSFYTGMRKSEILRLVWLKVNMKARLIQLEAIDTKTKQPRTCPICDDLHKILASIPRALHDNHVILYCGKSIKDIRTSLKTACKNAGIIYGRKKRDGFTYHDLRHTFNTYMRKAGVDKEVIKAITGHETDAMYTRYNKIDSEDIQKAVGQYQEFLNVDQTVDQAGNQEGSG